MKRYDIAHYDIMGTGERDQLEIEEAVDGEWVDYTDAQAAIEAARAEERRAIAGELYSLANTLDSISAQEITRYADAIRSMEVDHASKSS